MSFCLPHVMEALAKRRPEDFDLPAIELTLNLPPGIQSLEGFSAVTAAATQRLLQLMGDVEALGSALCNRPTKPTKLTQLGIDFLNMSHAALLALLRSDELKARSVNSVLMVAHAWVTSPAGEAHSEQQLRQVVECLRLSQLSMTFLFEVLPQLGGMKLGAKEIASVGHFACEMPNWRAVFLKQKLYPAQWFATSIRSGLSSGVLAFQADITRVELKKFLVKGQPGIRLHF